MNDPVEYLDLDDVLDLVPMRDVGLLGSAVAPPQTTVGAEDAYPDLWSEAAALLQSIVNNHALVDGNKRLGWLSTAVFLELSGEPATDASNDDVYELVMAVAATLITLGDLAERLRALVGR